MMQFHLLSFEGPDDYARAGGVATRVTGLARALAEAGHECHVWFIGDPELPGHERQGEVHLHRWCQWISGYHPAGVYDGEEGKRVDYATSLPPFLVEQFLAPALREGRRTVILAEEWHTVDAILHVDLLLRRQGLRERATMLWNANNTYSFERIPWNRLAQAAIITTVSRYMKNLMGVQGLDPLVIANGLEPEAFVLPERDAVAAFRAQTRGRTVVAKVARWHPDKRWLYAVDTVKVMKQRGGRPLLLARGGVESHGTEVYAAAAAAGLRVVEPDCTVRGASGLLAAMRENREADILCLRMPLDAEARRLLFRCSEAVLANSEHEPFGLVGLETMAAGGIACVGTSGEDYAIPGNNALALETNDPNELVSLLSGLRRRPDWGRAMRGAARRAAEMYRYSSIVERVLLPRLSWLAGSADRAAPQPRIVARRSPNDSASANTERLRRKRRATEQAACVDAPARTFRAV
jgi:glycosyltransferase involved in cell wall biosynthesis